jgi:hypothetical protein
VSVRVIVYVGVQVGVHGRKACVYTWVCTWVCVGTCDECGGFRVGACARACHPSQDSCL